MSDLIERLRGIRRDGVWDADCTEADAHPVCTEAADALAAVEAILVQARDGEDIYLRARINSAIAILAKQEAEYSGWSEDVTVDPGP